MSQKRGTREKNIVMLTRLYAEALRLIERNERSPVRIQGLFTTLSGFVRNEPEQVKLDVLPKKSRRFTGSLQNAFSLTFEAVGCSAGVRSFCRDHGVVYLGEYSVLKWRLRSDKFSPARRELDEILAIHRIPPGTDPVLRGWSAPYWNDPEWVEAMKAPLPGAFYGALDQKEQSTNPLTLGDILLIVNRPGFAPTRLRWITHRISNLDPSLRGVVRAGMRLPFGWSASKGVVDVESK